MPRIIGEVCPVSLVWTRFVPVCSRLCHLPFKAGTRSLCCRYCRNSDTYIHTYIHYTTLHYTTLHYTTLHYTTLHYTTLHYTTLHYTTYMYVYIYIYIHIYLHVYKQAVEIGSEGVSDVHTCPVPQARQAPLSLLCGQGTETTSTPPTTPYGGFRTLGAPFWVPL